MTARDRAVQALLDTDGLAHVKWYQILKYPFKKHLSISIFGVSYQFMASNCRKFLTHNESSSPKRWSELELSAIKLTVKPYSFKEKSWIIKHSKN